LFFKPPIESVRPLRRAKSKQLSNWTTDTEKSSNQKEIAKAEIETLIYKLNNDLNVNNLNKKEVEDKKSKESELAKSAQTRLRSSRAKFELIKETLSRAMAFKRKRSSIISLDSFLKRK
jgi:hypothetical protein